jgi:fatty-acyl-CoA synthase/long-chain acyl-CoA synthetase
MTAHGGLTAQDLLRRACENYADRPVATLAGETWTYQKAWKRGGRLASILSERGLKKCDFVGVIMSNRLDYLTANLACVRGGFVNVPMNDMLTPEEFEYMFADSGARAAVVGDGFTGTVADLEAGLPDLEIVIAVDDNPPNGQIRLTDLLEEGDSETLDAGVGPDDLLRLSYTGGTTGRPKGARHTHGTIATNMLAHVVALEIRDAEEMLLMTPLPHSAGYIHLAGLTQGAHFTITRGFDPGEFLRVVDREPITWTFLVPTMIYRTLDHESLDTTDVSELDTIVYGAAPITPERLAEARDALGNVFVQAYGQTEMPDIGMILPKSDHVIGEQQVDSCGKPATMVDAGIADLETEATIEFLPRGEEGELVMRSPYVMDGYHGKPEKTDATLVEGWLRTGDVARMDEHGYVYLLDRANDVIISGGMNVYTIEVEESLDKHSSVNQVAVIGIPDDDWGEAVHAVIVPDSNDLDEADLKTFAAGRLSAYKKPKSVEFVERIPTTPYGKMDKKALREPYWDEANRDIN